MCTSKGGSLDYGIAQNMSGINTPFIDMSPCYHDSLKVLFFASNGHEGFGGLDLFMSKSPKFDEYRNLGLPFNSNRDDFYMVAGKRKGYLSSNREGGIGNDDIYWFDLQSKQTVITVVDQDSLGVATSVSITGEVFYRFNHLPAEGVEIALLDADGNVVKTVRTNENGEFRFENLPGISGYRVLLDENDPTLAVNARYQAGKLGHMGKDGAFLDENDPNLTVDVKFDVNNLKVTKSDKPASRVLFENIYFDFDKADLRPEARKVLDELVKYYKANKDNKIQIELQANTDAFGSDVYNVNLSRARGNAAQAYLMKNGVNRSALTISPKGKSAPIATNDNAAGRQLNRRIEFYIIGGEGFETKAMAYIVEPKTDIYSIAKKFNMTVEELKELNALEGEDVQAFRPLRVRRAGDKDLFAPITSAAYQLSKEEEMKYVPDHAGVKGGNKTWNTGGGAVSRQPEVAEEGYHIVEPLNTWTTISKQYNISVADLKALNNATGNRLQIGQKVRVSGSVASVSGGGSASGKVFGQNTGTDTDAEGKYKVQDGDTMYSIAKRFGITVEELMQMNNLDSYTLYRSMRLKVKK
jgi:peptidoglycan-associated lipoprotein